MKKYRIIKQRFLFRNFAKQFSEQINQTVKGNPSDPIKSTPNTQENAQEKPAFYVINFVKIRKKT